MIFDWRKIPDETNFEEERLKALIKKRGSFKQKRTYFEKYVEKVERLPNEIIDGMKIVELERRIETTETLLINFYEVHIEIECSVERTRGVWRQISCDLGKISIAIR